MADDNTNVFTDVDAEANSILENDSCIVPSMADNTISKLSSTNIQNSHHSENEQIFDVLKENDQSSQESHFHDHHDVGDEDVVVVVTPGTPASNIIKHQQANILGTHTPSAARTPKWTLETMATAMDSVLAGELTTTMAARKFQIPRTTLLDRLSMKVKVQYLDVPGTFPLNPENDALLVEFVKENLSLDKHTLIKGLINQAEELAKQQGKPFSNPLMSRKWLKLFVYKHPNLDILRTASKARTTSSHTGVNNSNYQFSSPRSSSIDLSKIEIMTQDYVLSSPNQVSSEDDVETKYNHRKQQHQEMEDSFEANLAKQGFESIERKLTQEQTLYFNYRFYNNTLEKGYDLWRMCKARSDDSESFESILSMQALTGMENALDEEHLKYFHFRYENTNLEEGYKLWAILKEKCS